MKLLIVAATQAEIDPLLTYFAFDGSSLQVTKHQVDVLITHVGMVPTAFALGGKLAHHHYDLAINLGIAGSFVEDIAIGDVVYVTQDVFAEWGAENHDDFISIDSLGFGESVHLASNLPLLTKIPLKNVIGITVNKVHGNEVSIKNTLVRLRLQPQIESMEGAAFLYACNQRAIDCVQIRAISNWVEPRNRQNWNITLAIKNLNQFAIKFLENI